MSMSVLALFAKSPENSYFLTFPAISASDGGRDLYLVGKWSQYMQVLKFIYASTMEF